MKKMKRRSYKSTLLILLMTAILLIVSTYAWFTSNRTVTVETIEVNVGTVNGLQISTNATTWKSLITRDDILTGAYSGAVNALPTSTLKPVSSALEQSESIDGYMKMFYGVVEANESTGNYQITSTLLADADQRPVGENPVVNGYYIVFDMFLKVDLASTVYLTNSSSVVGKTEADVAKGLQNATRIAFVKEGNVGPNEDATGLDDFVEVILWEPNNNAHTDSAITHAASTYGLTGQNALGATDVIASYPGVKTTFTNLALSESYPNATTLTQQGTNAKFKTITPSIATGTSYTSQTSNFVEFDDLAAGITKYRVYMWIEGQDFDCQNDASGSTMQFNLQFSLDNHVTSGS